MTPSSDRRPRPWTRHWGLLMGLTLVAIGGVAGLASGLWPGLSPGAVDDLAVVVIMALIPGVMITGYCLFHRLMRAAAWVPPGGTISDAINPLDDAKWFTLPRAALIAGLGLLGVLAPPHPDLMPIRTVAAVALYLGGGFIVIIFAGLILDWVGDRIDELVAALRRRLRRP